MAKISKPPISIKLYRNFAITTVLITGVFAMFADDDNRDAIQAEYEVQAANLEKRSSQDEPTMARREPTAEMVVGSFEGDSADFGSPMIKPEGNARGLVGGTIAARNGETRSAPGYSQVYLDGLSEEEYQQLLAGLDEAGMLDPKTRRDQIAALQRASRRRSGQATRAY